MDVERCLAAVARRQHGLVTRRQALDAGLTTRQVERRAASGRWASVRQGVYAGGWVPPSREQAMLAVALAVGQPCAVSHGTAALVWRLPVPEPDDIHLSTPAFRRISQPGVRHHRPRHWFLADVTLHRRIPVTTVARTLADCGPLLPGDALGEVVDDAVRRRLLRLADLAACVERLVASGSRRVGPVCRVLEQRAERQDPGGNRREIAVLDVLRWAGMPLPVQQHRVVVGGRRRSLDFAYPEQRVGIEFDGFAEHGLLRSTFDDDRVRGNALATAGWLLLHFTSASSREEIVERTREALTLADARPG